MKPAFVGFRWIGPTRIPVFVLPEALPLPPVRVGARSLTHGRAPIAVSSAR